MSEVKTSAQVTIQSLLDAREEGGEVVNLKFFVDRKASNITAEGIRSSAAALMTARRSDAIVFSRVCRSIKTDTRLTSEVVGSFRSPAVV